jgi:glutamine synthetase
MTHQRSAQMTSEDGHVPAHGGQEAGDGTTPLPDGVDTVELVLGDSAGILRGKRIPAAMWSDVAEHGVAIANLLFEWSPLCEVRDDAPYSAIPNGIPDIHLTPLLDTLRRVPWRPGAARVLCEAREADGSPVRVDPRDALRRVVRRATELGYEAKTAFEIEFYLLDAATHRPREDTMQCYSMERGASYEAVLAPIRNLIRAFGIPVEACNTEYAQGQFEVNLRYGEALETADGAIQFRNAVKEIAHQHGWLATFMAKPFDGLSGSGVHIHQSLWREGRNAFSDEDGRLSEIGRFYLGGLQRHMPALTLLGSPTPNAMKRREDYSFCPTTATWGGDNRTVGIRVIEGRPSAVRIEQRDAAADCNPYLVIAAQIAAGLDGIERRTEPSARCDRDGYADEDAVALARTIPEAVHALRDSAFATEVFDPLLIETFIGFCEFEHRAIHSHVTELERQRYLEAF